AMAGAVNGAGPERTTQLVVPGTGPFETPATSGQASDAGRESTPSGCTNTANASPIGADPCGTDRRDDRYAASLSDPPPTMELQRAGGGDEKERGMRDERCLYREKPKPDRDSRIESDLQPPNERSLHRRRDRRGSHRALSQLSAEPGTERHSPGDGATD